MDFELVGIVSVVLTLFHQGNAGISSELGQFFSNRVFTMLIEAILEVVGNFVLVGLTIEVVCPSWHIGNEGSGDMRTTVESFT